VYSNKQLQSLDVLNPAAVVYALLLLPLLLLLLLLLADHEQLLPRRHQLLQCSCMRRVQEQVRTNQQHLPATQRVLEMQHCADWAEHTASKNAILGKQLSSTVDVTASLSPSLLQHVQSPCFDTSILQPNCSGRGHALRVCTLC
jgi:hypothetical protein